MKRLIDAFHNSVRAFRRLAGSEAAFQQELALLVLALPVGWFLSTSWRGYALLVGSVPGIVAGSLIATGLSERILVPILAITLVIVGMRLLG